MRRRLLRRCATDYIVSRYIPLARLVPVLCFPVVVVLGILFCPSPIRALQQFIRCLSTDLTSLLTLHVILFFLHIVMSDFANNSFVIVQLKAASVSYCDEIAFVVVRVGILRSEILY